MDEFSKLKQRCEPFKNQKKLVQIVTTTPEETSSSIVEVSPLKANGNLCAFCGRKVYSNDLKEKSCSYCRVYQNG